MANFEDEVRDLREKNSELVLEVQFWRVTAAQKEKEKIELMKDINELRLKLTRLRSGGAAEARKLDAGLQIASEEALSHLVQASGAVTRTIELAKQYMRDRQELDNKSPRWSSIGGTPREKVHRVPPLLIGGQSIQPVVSLTRTMLNSSTRARSPNNHVTQRAVPMRMLQDVYIPLTRIDMADMHTNNMETEVNNSTEDLGLDDSSEHEMVLNEQILEESQNLSEEFETSRRLDAVIEDLDEDQLVTPPRSRVENPLEGPSWLLDVPTQNPSPPLVRVNLEPDSTTPCEDVGAASPADRTLSDLHKAIDPLPAAMAFTPTMRRRKRSATHSPPSPWGSPHHSPRLPIAVPAATINYNGNRVLKVLVAKMRMSNNTSGGGDASLLKRTALAASPSKRTALTASPPNRSALDTSPPKRTALAASPSNSSTADATPQRRSTTDAWPSPERAARSPRRAESSPPKRSISFDAPSPNGATDAGVIVSLQRKSGASREPAAAARCDSRSRSRDSRSRSRLSHDSRGRGCDSDSDGSAALLAAVETRSRRTRKAVTYKEKPLNRKLRR